MFLAHRSSEWTRLKAIAFQAENVQNILFQELKEYKT